MSRLITETNVTAWPPSGQPQVIGGASEAARFLRALANPNRLVVLGRLQAGEQSVTDLLEHVPLSQSALSQHLAVLRNEGLVETRRSAQIIYYRIADDRVRHMMPVLDDLFWQGMG